jgi:lactate dehydrogenase-like 2-hydroxyacid dehydrogenase
VWHLVHFPRQVFEQKLSSTLHHHNYNYYNKTTVQLSSPTRATRHDTTNDTTAGEGTKTKVLVRVGMGIDSVDLQAAGERGTFNVHSFTREKTDYII